MKTILYNPIFINPQAYYVFPRLTRYLQPDNESTVEPANYIGTIEVKVIAYGDTTLKRTYSNTDYIDLSEFKNTWIRISLFTKVGSCVLGEWKIGNVESDLPYIDPEVLASLKAVVIVGNKTNNDSDRAIVKNLVDPDNPFVISNAAYTEGSGYADKGSPYYGAFVTDGIDDLITSTKTVQEMGITDEVTVVSMIHQIDLNSTYTIATTNYIENSNSKEHVRSDVYNYGKTGIYGYSASLINNTKSDIKNILGDEADYYVKSTNSLQTIFDAKFSVVGRISELTEASQVAWYWTIIANKVLTTDQINQVIAYFNLDRTLRPDILCNTIKQGITNENHAEFGDKLIDYSGNGRDIQLNNIAWNKESGIDDDGALRLDGINDFGKVTGMPIYKDYTFIIDYERISYASSERWVAGVVSKSHVANQGAFILMTANTTVEPGKQAYSFGGVTSFNRDDFTRALLYQSKYKCGDVDLTVGEGVDSDTLWLGTFRDNDQRFFNGAIYSLMSFPYSMSEFLIERQLKKHKLGTLYPDMVEFRPVIKANANYKITYYQIDSTNTWKSIKVGDYIVIGAKLAFQITFDNDASELKEVVSPQLSGIIVEKRPSNPGYNIYSYITSKSPQKINITIDEYIRYEDIVQPYPVLLRFNDENGNEVSWGGKFKVGSTITRIGSIADPESNLLNGLYSVSGLSLNGKAVTSSTSIVEKQMVFKTTATWLLDNNKPKCILSPSRLRIPNSSYKILGHIPDISGHGNHGVINNSAYAKGSGVNEDGSYQFDGVDDFVTIPTLSSGGKQVLMKVNWDKTITYAILYDQRGYPNEFAIYNADVDNNNNPVFAYQARNNGQTYIDGILNKNIKASELRAITHNITITNELSTGTNTSSPVIGSNRVHDAYFTNMALYDFMLFDNISTDDKILELNEYVGIEGNTE